jgi:hypothetical protein
MSPTGKPEPVHGRRRRPPVVPAGTGSSSPTPERDTLAPVIPLAGRGLPRHGSGVSGADPFRAADPFGAAPSAGPVPSTVAWEQRVAGALAFLRRRVTGAYEVDEFGFDPDLADHVAVPMFLPLF